MSQYFNWVNLDRSEIIADWPWPNGQGVRESAYLGCEETDAALTMIAGDWAGDLVVFLGDYAEFKNETHPGRREVERRLDGTSAEHYMYECTDICGRFDYVRDHPEVRHPVFSDDSRDATWVPYDGPRNVAIHCYRYVVNESKREYVDRFRTAVRQIDGRTGVIVRYDPVPELMCSGTGGLDDPEHKIDGLWFGDVILPTDERPGDGYKAVAQWYSYFGPPLNCPDEEIGRIISEYGLDIADGDILERVYACLSEGERDGAENLRV